MHQPIPLGGLMAVGSPEDVPIDRANVCHDCVVLPDGSVDGRHGYRNVLAEGTAVATPASGVQGLWRFRPHPSLGVTIAVIDGVVWWGRDPSTEAGTVASWTYIGAAPSGTAVFSATAKISGCQMGSYFYLASDVAGAAWQRVAWNNVLTAGCALSLASIAAISAPTLTSFSESSSYSITEFNGLSAPSASGAALYSAWPSGTNLPTGWRVMAGTSTNTRALVGSHLTFTLPDASGQTGADWGGCDWLLVVVSPQDTGSENGKVEISVAAQVAGSPGTFVTLGEVHDVPPIAGSPNHVYLSLAGLPDTVRRAAKYMRFTLVGGSATSRYVVFLLGYCAFYGLPSARPGKYTATVYNASTLQESELSNTLEVNPTAAISAPSFVDLYAGDDGGWLQGGASRASLRRNDERCFNVGYGLDYPVSTDAVGSKITVTITKPASGWAAGSYVRLWKETETGRRLVGTSSALAGSESTVTIADTMGVRILSQQKYKVGGTPPAVSALVAKGRRILAAGAAPTGAAIADQHPERLYVSSYAAPAEAQDAYPTFPAVPVDDADGWQMDLASKLDAIRCTVEGDALYLLTTEHVYSMGYLSHDQTPSMVADRGVLGSRGAIYAEQMLVWAAPDGIWAAANRAERLELTADVRDTYTGWLVPSSGVVLAYKDRMLYVYETTRMMTYSFVTGRWATGTLAHSIVAAASWSDGVTGRQQAWLATSGGRVVRMGAGATRDDDVARPAWEYRTGYDMAAVNGRVAWMLVDASGPVDVALHRDEGSVLFPQWMRMTPRDAYSMVERHGAADQRRSYRWGVGITAAADVRLRGLWWERSEIESRGG